MKILLAEDTKDLSRAVCAVLSREGYEVEPAYDGEEALSYIMRSGYDCVVFVGLIKALIKENSLCINDKYWVREKCKQESNC